MEKSNKKRLVALLLAFFLGTLGVHRFYVGKKGSGIAMVLLTISIIGILVSSIWAFVDFLMIATGSFTDSENKIIKDWE